MTIAAPLRMRSRRLPWRASPALWACICLVLAVGLLAAGRGPLLPAADWLRTELYFGSAIPAGGHVSDADWADFVRTSVTERFPAGITTIDANGQWRDPRGGIVHEDSHVLVLLHRGSAADDDCIEAIRRDYVVRFRQDAVLRVDAPARVRL